MKRRTLIQVPYVNEELTAFLKKFIEETEQVDEQRGVVSHWRFHVRPEQTQMIRNLLLAARDMHYGTRPDYPVHLIFLDHNPGGEVVNRLVTLRLENFPQMCEGCIDLEEVQVDIGQSVDCLAATLLERHNEQETPS